MKLKYLGICILPIIALLSCTKEEGETSRVLRSDEECRFSVEEAEDIFSERTSKVVNARFNILNWNLGEISPDWSEAERVHDHYNGNDNVETEFISRYRIQFRIKEEGGKDYEFLYSEHKLLIVRDNTAGLSGAFVLWYIADRSYFRSHRRSIHLCKTFHNDGNMKEFSGLMVYTRLDGQVVRANRYDNGKLIDAVYLAAVKSESEYLSVFQHFHKIIGNLLIARKASLAKTKSDDDSTGSDYFDVIDSSVCVDSFPDEGDDSDWWNDTFFTNPIPSNFENPREIDPSSGDHCGGGEQISKIESGKWNNIPIIAPKGSLNDFLAKINRYTDISEITKLLSLIKLNQISKISVEDEIPEYDAKTQPNSSYSQFQIDVVYNCADGIIFEELLHVLQYQTEKGKWKRGDREFEAKVFDAYLQIKYGYPKEGIYFTERNKLIPFENFRINPCKETYDAAITSLRTSPFCYYETLYPVTPESRISYEDRIKHLKEIIK
jgi:hypothetical protein